MKLDGFEVKLGDAVYDTILGAGVVVSLHDDSEERRFTVRFGQHRQLTYNEQGFCHHKNRTLYWKNPFIVIPVKDDGLWELQKELCMTATRLIQERAGAFKS